MKTYQTTIEGRPMKVTIPENDDAMTDAIAAERHASHLRDVAVLMDCLQMEIDEHAKRADGKTEMAHVVEIGMVRDSLRSALQSLLIARHGWSRIEAARFVSEHLEEMREDREG